MEDLQAFAGNAKVFAVTHSMGAIVLRHIMGLEDHGGVNWAGSILLAPPNNGSTVARILSQVFNAECLVCCMHQSISWCRAGSDVIK